MPKIATNIRCAVLGGPTWAAYFGDPFEPYLSESPRSRSRTAQTPLARARTHEIGCLVGPVICNRRSNLLHLATAGSVSAPAGSGPLFRLGLRILLEFGVADKHVSQDTLAYTVFSQRGEYRNTVYSLYIPFEFLAKFYYRQCSTSDVYI